MTFQEDIDELRERQGQQAEARRLKAEAAERERTAARAETVARERRAAEALLPQFHEAVAALRADSDRSRASLKNYRENIFSVLGPSWTRREERRLFQGRKRTYGPPEFDGWWVRREPFEFLIPLHRPPSARLRLRADGSLRASMTIEAFAATAIHEYTVQKPDTTIWEHREENAERALRHFLATVKVHLVELGPATRSE